MLFATGSEDLQLHALDNTSVQRLAVYEPKSAHNYIKNICWSHDNIYLTILQENSFPEILSTKHNDLISLVHCITSVQQVTTTCFKKRTKRIIALGTKNGEIAFYDTKTRTIKSNLEGLQSHVTQLEFSHNDQQLAVIFDKNLRIFSNVTDDDSTTFTNYDVPHLDNCSVMRYSSLVPHEVAVGCQDGLVRLWDTKAQEEVFLGHIHCEAVTGIGFSDREKLMITTGMDHKIVVTDCVSQECVFRMNLHAPVTAVDISPDSRNIIAGLFDGSIYVYDIRDHIRPLMTTKAHCTPVFNINFANKLQPKAFMEQKESSTIMESKVMFHHFSKGGEERQARSSAETVTTDERKSSIPTSKPSTTNQLLADPVMQNFMKKHLSKVIKPFIEDLEGQLKTHCDKFQHFVTNEFDALHKAMSRWDVFNVDDMSDAALPNISGLQVEELCSNSAKAP